MLNRWVLLLVFTMVFPLGVFAGTENCREIVIPIEFDAHGLPILDISLNDKRSKALLDLGSADSLHLPLSIIKQMPGLNYTGGSIKSSHIKGELFESKEFLISKLKVDCMIFTDIKGLELDAWAASIGEGEDIESGSEEVILGLGFFEGKKIILNYLNKTLTVTNAIKNVLSANDKKKFFPYKISNEGISIQVNSPHAVYQMVLDSGASSSIFVADKVSEKDSVEKCSYDLGPNIDCRVFNSPLRVFGNDFSSEIILYPIDKRFQLDGILGGDFFQHFVTEIDFLNKTISLSSESKPR